METKKYYVIKKTNTFTNGEVSISYFKGYSKWISKYEKAKLYLKNANVKKALDGLTTYPNIKYEILYITTTIETIDDIAEKEIFD
jgi:hypothetical protein